MLKPQLTPSGNSTWDLLQDHAAWEFLVYFFWDFTGTTYRGLFPDA